MKIKLSKSQWEFMGRKAGWIGKKAEYEHEIDPQGSLTDQQYYESQEEPVNDPSKFRILTKDWEIKNFDFYDRLKMNLEPLDHEGMITEKISEKDISDIIYHAERKGIILSFGKTQNGFLVMINLGDKKYKIKEFKSMDEAFFEIADLVNY